MPKREIKMSKNTDRITFMKSDNIFIANDGTKCIMRVLNKQNEEVV